MKNNKYHYTMCGLDNIYLLNGFDITKTPYGDAISIRDIDGLHGLIASNLINKSTPLTSAEFIFLRREMKLTQVMLAAMFGTSDQTVARIEKGTTRATVTYEAAFRALANEIICKQRSEMTSIINEINTRNDARVHEILLKMDDTRWKRTAA